MTLTNNGSSLDAGNFTLNSYGYFEDLVVQLPGGTNSVKAAYGGDNSFNATSATQAITITPAGSSMNAPSVQNYFIGSAFNANAMVQSLSSGVPPTGTVTFLAKWHCRDRNSYLPGRKPKQVRPQWPF